MIPIVVCWANYTATIQGRILKLVACENCSTEYVYVLEREGIGSGTSVYGIHEESALGNAESGAEEILEQYLTNDFDAVPCPNCGHYQRYMFPKLIDTRSPWPVMAAIATLIAALVSLVSALYWGFKYFQRPNDHTFGRLVTAGLCLVVAGLFGICLSALQRRKAHRFDPNTVEDRHDRIARGRSRAMTRAEFEAIQQKQPPANELSE